MFEWQGRHFMIPETARNKTVEVYACESFPGDWKLETVLLEGVPGRDATLFEVDGLWWMFVAIADAGASDELHLYYSSTPLGPWRRKARRKTLARLITSSVGPVRLELGLIFS